jgi:hypothetical protein
MVQMMVDLSVDQMDEMMDLLMADQMDKMMVVLTVVHWVV